MTPPYQHLRPADSSQSARSWFFKGAVVACASIVVFAGGLSGKFFEDEYAYISQSYFADYFFAGKFHDPVWLEFPAYDLPPLPKYMIGAALHLAQLPMPRPGAWWEWYDHYGHFGTPLTLWVARLPIIVVGAIGCLAIFALGGRIKDSQVGLIAAIGLMLNPLYRLHAHRAMSDVPAEAFTLLALALFLWFGQRAWVGRPTTATALLPALAGIAAGLALLSKFSGLLGLMVIAAWSGLTLIAPSVAPGRKLVFAGGAIVTAAIAFAVFVASNPFMTARPTVALRPELQSIASQSLWQRLDLQVKRRLQSSEIQKVNFPDDALFTGLDKSLVFAVQGFGRFGPLGPSLSDSTVRFDRRQDWGALVWGALVLYGLVTSIKLGLSQYRRGQPPAALALVVWAAVAWAVVIFYLPMAWDRYLLPIQSGNALLAAVGAASIGARFAAPMGAIARRPAAWVFLILIGSYAFFWHTRDWNTASRLMLTYAIVDRGTVTITGLDQQTNDKAFFQGQYFSDKLPGFSLLATVPYGIARAFFRLPGHPLDVAALSYWDADYWCTLGTSGLFTALTGALLSVWAGELGCSPRRAVLIALAFGLATPAYVYATLAYGHQTSSLALFASFFLLWQRRRVHDPYRVFGAGFLAAYAAVIELQVGPVSAILGLYLLVQCLRGERRPDSLSLFAIGAVIPTLILLTYNQLAFGSPWDMGYFHHATKQFAAVHNPDNPLGVRAPDHFWQRLFALLWGRYRGLTFYAPILLLTVPGWVVLIKRKCWDLAAVTFLVVVAVLLVNLFYPEWTGGWSTGPRLLVPLIPFAILPVAALLVGDSRRAMAAAIIAGALALAGGVIILMFQAVGGRVPQDFGDPLVQTIWPLWTGQLPLPYWRFGERFARNLVPLIAPGWLAQLGPRWQFAQIVPLVLAQAAAIVGLWHFAGDRTDASHSGQSQEPRSS